MFTAEPVEMDAAIVGVGIPRGLDEMPPGPHLAAILSTLDVDVLSGHDRIAVLRAEQRMASHYQARTYQSMRSVSDCYAEMTGATDADLEETFENTSAEIRAALSLTRRAADRELDFAMSLSRRLPRVVEAFVNGDIDMRKAKIFDYQTEHLPAETARLISDRMVGEAANLTTGQLRARIRRLCIEVDPDQAKERYEHAREQRRTVTGMTESGTAHYLGQGLDPHLVAAASNNVNRIARTLKTADDPRTMDQIRADVFIDLLQGKTIQQATPGGSVNIHVELTTLAELDDRPADLAGCGPIHADIARQAVATQEKAEWRYTITDRGRPIATGTTTRRPNAATRRAVQAMYPTCTFPGCRMPAENCDLDHRIPWAQGGPTDVGHLAPACRHDHVIRHRAGWTYTRLANGDHKWTSPFRHTYTTRPERPP